MSIKCAADVWASRLPTTLRFTVLALAWFAKDDGRSIFPSVATIARMTGLSARQVRKHITELEKRGVLVAESSRAGGRQHTTHWRLDLAVLGTMNDESRRLRDGGGVHDTTTQPSFDEWFAELVSRYPPDRVNRSQRTKSAFRQQFQRDDRPAEVVWAEMVDNLANQQRGEQWRLGMVPRLRKWLDNGLWRQRHDEPQVGQKDGTPLPPLCQKDGTPLPPFDTSTSPLQGVCETETRNATTQTRNATTRKAERHDTKGGTGVPPIRHDPPVDPSEDPSVRQRRKPRSDTDGRRTRRAQRSPTALAQQPAADGNLRVVIKLAHVVMNETRLSDPSDPRLLDALRQRCDVERIEHEHDSDLLHKALAMARMQRVTGQEARS